MFIGHFAAALVAKRAEPTLPLGTLTAAGFGLDLLWPIFVLAGLEHFRVDPGNTRFTPLAFDHYPWSHSLAMALVWSLLAALTFRRGGTRRAAIIVGAVVFSHWLLDLSTHRPDLPLWPTGGMKVGLGLWNSIAGTLVVEGALLAVALRLYGQVTRARGTAARLSLYCLVTLMLAAWISGPFAPPPPSPTAVAISALAIWIFVFWAGWIDRSRTSVKLR